LSAQTEVIPDGRLVRVYVMGDEFRNYHKAVLDPFDWIRQCFEDHGDEYYPR